jgi:hypothetical protein
MTITLEELKKMKLKGIRSVVPAKPRPKDLKGVNFPIKTLVGKEIIVIDWIKVEHGVINPAKPPIKIQFYLGDILGVCFTSSEDFVQSLEEYYHLNGDKVVPFHTRICHDGRRYYMEDIDNE